MAAAGTDAEVKKLLLNLPKAGEAPKAGAAAGARDLGAAAARGSKWGVARSSVVQFRGLGGLSTSYFLEKQAVVLDLGRAYTKVGFATESRPRHIFATPELRALRRKGPCLSVTATEEEWVDKLEKLMTLVFFHYLSVSPKDRRVVVCDAAQYPVQFRNALAFVLFKRFAVPAVSFVADLVLPLYLTGLHSGIVIDCGYEAARVLATFAGVPVLSALSAANCGGRRLQRSLSRSLRRRLPADLLGAWVEDGSVLEDIAVRACYVTCTFPSPNEGETPVVLRSDKAMPYTPPGHVTIDLPAESRWEPFEVLFSAEEAAEEDVAEECCSCSSIPEAFVQTLCRCPLDVRVAAVQNVVVCGGCAALRGLLPRLALELREALGREPKVASLVKWLRICPLDFSPAVATWTGGAVFAALEGAGDLSREDYERGQPLPDWAKEGYV